MLTPREINNLVTEINKSFEQDRKRLADLEARVAELEEAKPKRGRPAKTEEAA